MERTIPLLIESKNGHDEEDVPESQLPEKTNEQLAEGKMVTLEKEDTTEVLTEEVPKANWKDKFAGVESATATSKMKGG
jgi:hypothetical protein